jgi:hypothetical protein
VNTIIRDAQLAIRTYVPLSIEGCLITEGIDGIQAYADLTVTNSTFHDLSSSAIRLYAGSLSVTGSTIYDCSYGIDQSPLTSTGAITCTGSFIHDCGYRAISVPYPSGGVTVRGTTIQDATDGIFLAYQDPATIDSCTIKRNDIGIASIYGFDTVVHECALDSNTTNGAFAISDSLTIQADTVTHSAVGVYLVYNSAGVIEQNTRLSNNGVGLKCDYASSPTVRNARINANADGVVALNSSNPDLGHASADTCGAGPDEGANSIHDNSGYDVINATSGITVSAECSWWDGVPQAAQFSGAVDYVPYRTSDPNPSGLESMRIPPGPEEEPDRLPMRYDLGLNHPNPFNPVTSARWCGSRSMTSEEPWCENS